MVKKARYKNKRGKSRKIKPLKKKYASSLNRKKLLQEKRKLENKKFMVSKPFRNTLDGQRVWTIRYKK